MVMIPRAAAFVCLLLTIGAASSSSVYENSTRVGTHGVEPIVSTTSDATSASSTRVGDYVMQGINGAATTDSQPLSSLSTTQSSQSPTVTPVDTYYTGQALSGSDWQLFTSKTERPIRPISWASPMPEVEKCWSDIVTWRNSSISWWNRYIASTKFSNSVVATETTVWMVTETATETTIYPTNASTYTLCDGSPRVDIRPVTSTITSNVTKLRTTLVPTALAFPQTQPCIPGPGTCRRWYYDSNINITSEDELLQQCGRPTGLYEPCLVAGGPVQLIYWPEGDGENDICPNNASMSLRHPSYSRNRTTTVLPDTITALGTTFTTGSVYLSFHTLYASYDGFYDRVGPTFKDTIIAVPSSAMSTHCGGFTEAHGPATALNYADLNWPVAASAYNCQARCDYWRFVGHDSASASAPECSTIWSDVNPNIAVPSMVRDLVPEWAHCSMSGFRIPNFWHDPPIALTQTSSLALPTDRTREPASPSSAITSTIPIETGATDSKTDGVIGPIVETQSSRQSAHSDRPLKVETGRESELSRTTADSETNIATKAGQDFSTFASPTSLSSPTFVPPIAGSSLSSAAVNTDTGSLDSFGSGKGPSQEDDSTPTKTATTGSVFSYEPQVPSLDALSVLESALSALTGTIRSDHMQATSASATDVGVPSSDLSIVRSNTSPIVNTAKGSAAQGGAQHTVGDDAVTTTLDALGKPPMTSNGDSAITSSSRYSQAASLTSALPEPALPSVVQEPQPQQSALVALDLTVTLSRPSDAPDAIVFGSHTLRPDDPIATLDGHVVSATSSGLVLISSGSTIDFSEISASSDRSRVPPESGSLTSTAEATYSSSEGAGIEATTSRIDGGHVTLPDSQTTHPTSSGSEVFGLNSTVPMSSMPGVVTEAAASSFTGISFTAEYPTETSSSAESAGSKSSERALGLLCAIMFVAACVVH